MAAKSPKVINITPPKFQILTVRIRGTAALVQHAFGAKAAALMKEAQEAGDTGRNARKKEPKDFQALYEEAKHVSTEGWLGIPSNAFRCALVDACKIVGFPMTKAKLAIYVRGEGIDKVQGTPLVRIYGEPEYFESAVRLQTGVADIRARPMFKQWECNLRIDFDSGMFTTEQVVNLLMRAGMQVGVQEGRPNSPDSCGMGWGTFEIVNE